MKEEEKKKAKLNLNKKLFKEDYINNVKDELLD